MVVSQSAKKRVKVQLYKPHAGQLRIHKSKARFRVVACGRRFGKTLMACNEVSRFALEKNGANCAWVAPTYRQSKIAYRLIRRALRDVISYKTDSELRLEFSNGSSIQFFSSDNYDALRGNGFHMVVLDECADINEKAWTEVLRPTLSDTQGKALFIGTPKGRNFFFRLFARGDDPDYPDWASFHASTYDNPYVPKQEIDDAKKELPDDTFAQEYLAEFLEESAGVFKGIDRCIKGLLDPEYKRVKGHFYVAGFDPAKYQDYSVLTVIDCHARRLVAYNRINQVDYTVQIDMVARIAQEFCATVYMDVTGVGAPLAENLKTEARKRNFRVEEYLFTNASKKELVEKLQLAIQHGDIEIPDIPVLVNELKIYEYQMTPSRNITYGAPKGAHDDAATSLMLANYGMAQPRGPVMWSVYSEEATRTLEMPDTPENKQYGVMEIEKVEVEDWYEEGIIYESESY